METQEWKRQQQSVYLVSHSPLFLMSQLCVDLAEANLRNHIKIT